MPGQSILVLDPKVMVILLIDQFFDSLLVQGGYELPLRLLICVTPCLYLELSLLCPILIRKMRFQKVEESQAFSSAN